MAHKYSLRTYFIVSYEMAHKYSLPTYFIVSYEMAHKYSLRTYFIVSYKMPDLEVKLAVIEQMLTNFIYFKLPFCFGLAKNFEKLGYRKVIKDCTAVQTRKLKVQSNCPLQTSRYYADIPLLRTESPSLADMLSLPERTVMSWINC